MATGILLKLPVVLALAHKISNNWIKDMPLFIEAEYVTGSEKTRRIVNSMKFELAVLLNSSTMEPTILQVQD